MKKSTGKLQVVVWVGAQAVWTACLVGRWRQDVADLMGMPERGGK